MFASGHGPPAEWPGAAASQLQREVHVWPVELQAPQPLVECARSLLTEWEIECAEHFRVAQARNDFVLSRSMLIPIPIFHITGSLPAVVLVLDQIASDQLRSSVAEQ